MRQKVVKMISIINTLETDVVNNDKTILMQATPEKFIDRFCSKLNISDELTKVCKFSNKCYEERSNSEIHHHHSSWYYIM